MRLVKIEWEEYSGDWPYFYLDGFEGEWVKLTGADYPDGSAKHEGDSFWIHKSDIKSMQEVK